MTNGIKRLAPFGRAKCRANKLDQTCDVNHQVSWRRQSVSCQRCRQRAQRVSATVSRAISAASLSPRPERQTTITSSVRAARAASSMALATACELSSAGRMPSVRASASKAASASSSRQLVYAHAAGVFPVAVLRTDARIVEAGRDRMHVARLAVFVLHDVAVAAVQHAGLAVGQRRRMIARLGRSAAGFDADQFDLRVFDERIEHAGRIAAAADAGHDQVRQPADLLAALLDRFAADDRLKIAHDHAETDAARRPSRGCNASFRPSSSSRAWPR